MADKLPHGTIDGPFGLEAACLMQSSKHRAMPPQPMHLIHHRGRHIAPQVFEALAPKESVFGEHGAPDGRHIASDQSWTLVDNLLCVGKPTRRRAREGN